MKTIIVTSIDNKQDLKMSHKFENLNIQDVSASFTPIPLYVILNCYPNLRSIMLNNFQLDSKEELYFSSQLLSLTINNSNVSSKALSSIVGCTQLTSLSLHNCNNLDRLPFITSIPQLENLQLSECNQIEYSPETLPIPKGLRKLKITHCLGITKDILIAVLNSSLFSIEITF